MATDFAMRSLASSDEALLFEMLYLAIYVPEGGDPLHRDVVHTEALSKYVAGFGRDGDLGFAAMAAEPPRPLGAAWVRLFSVQQPGYGFVNGGTPELTIAVVPEARGMGIGNALLHSLLAAASARHAAVSLSVWPENPAFRLYQRFGFEIVEEVGPAVTMVKKLC